MTLSCSICKRSIEITFLGKIRGTFVGKRAMCSNCQRSQHIPSLKTS